MGPTVIEPKHLRLRARFCLLKTKDGRGFPREIVVPGADIEPFDMV
jgi:hypothetical protein